MASNVLSGLKRNQCGKIKKGRGRPMTAQGALQNIHDYLRDKKLSRYY